MGIVYWVAAGLLGVVLTAQAFRLRRGPSEQRAIAFFGLSNTYLALLFAAVALDTLLRAH
jgi:heme O synthase-like polyprenyltransferase